MRAKAERSVNYPASKYLMRFGTEKAHRRGKGQGNEEGKKERERHRGIITTITFEAFDHHSQKQTEKNKNDGRQGGGR